MDDSHEPPFQARKRMIDQQIVSRHFELEFGYDGAPRRHEDSLNPAQRLAKNAAEVVNPVKHFADDMK